MAGLSVQAQTTNLALSLNGQTSVSCGAITEMAGCAEYSIQFLMAPENWTSSAYIYRSGDGMSEFSARLSNNPGELIFKSGAAEITVGDLNKTGWSQVTLVVSAQDINVFVNGKMSQISQPGFQIPDNLQSFELGFGFTGRLDEFRLWNTDLSVADTDNLMLQNTVNKYHSEWKNLVVYYKFDQDQCADNIVDYKFKYHGDMNEPIVRIPVTDNSYFRYRTVSGYSDFNRHCDRLQIDREMHLMTNDLIMLNASVDGYTGKITMNAMDNGRISGGRYIEQHQSRKGVLSLDGSGMMELGRYAVLPGSPIGNALTFEGWFNLTQWKEGAYLFKKEENVQKRINIRLGKADQNELVVEAGEWTATFTNALQAVNVWQHIAVVVNPETGRNKIRLYVNNIAKSAPKIQKPDGQANFEIMNVDAEASIGSSFVGMMDEIMMWRTPRTTFTSDMDGTGTDLKFPGGGNGAIFMDAYWKFDDQNDLGLNLKGWKGMLKQIKEQYAGYRGFKVRLGLITPTAYSSGGKVWPDYIGKPEWRENLAKDVEALIPYCDGIDVDFEWLDNNPNNPKWTAYGEMVKSLRKVIPTDKVLSVSLHPVSYTLPKSKDVLGAIDFITFQNYGPRPTSLYYDAYKNFYDKALNYGIPAEKIRLSMATTVVRSDNSAKNVRGYKDLDFAQITAETNQSTIAGFDYTFNGVNEVKKKMRLMVDKNTGGCMYFDMGNDIAVQHELSLLRALNNVISANVDTIVTSVPPTTALKPITHELNNKIQVYPNPAKSFITIKGDLGERTMNYEISSVNGQLVASSNITEDDCVIHLQHLPADTYILHLFNSQKKYTEKIVIKH